MRNRELRRAILAKYDSLGAFADAMGVSRQTISNAICGRTVPRGELLAKMQDALGLSDSDLVQILRVEKEA